MTQPRPVTPRFSFDADLLGLAKLLARERADFTDPGDPGGQIKKRLRPPCIVTTPATKDHVWIPAVAAQGWLIVTRDRAIQAHRAELDAVRDHGAKMINLASPEVGSTWTQLEIFMTRWREIEALVDEPGPFIRVVSRTGALRAIPLA